ncbi:hypothetical protein PRIPAC_85538, partial [Pristionchus pacificus]
DRGVFVWQTGETLDFEKVRTAKNCSTVNRFIMNMDGKWEEIDKTLLVYSIICVVRDPLGAALNNFSSSMHWSIWVILTALSTALVSVIALCIFFMYRRAIKYREEANELARSEEWLASCTGPSQNQNRAVTAVRALAIGSG